MSMFFAPPMLNSPRAAAGGFASQVQTLLSGTAGFALDPTDTATMWQDSAKTTPVSANSQTVGNIDSKWGTTVYSFNQPTGSAAGLWNSSGYVDFDGVDDHLVAALTTYAFSSSLAGETITIRVRPTVISTAPVILNVSTSASTTNRRLLQINADGSISLTSRRANADTPTTITSAAGVIVAGTAYTIQTRINFTTDTIEIIVNGTQVASGTQGGTTTTASDASASNRTRIAANIAAAPALFFDANLGRIVYQRAGRTGVGQGLGRGDFGLTLSPANRRRLLKQAMQQMLLGPEGQLTPNARLLAIKLRRFCHAKGGELMFPRSGDRGPIDPLAMARVAGRREVFDYLAHLLGMNLEARQNLIEEREDE
jgi:hypothetical protein